MTGQTPGTPTNQATNNLQQLIFERQSHCIHQEKFQLPRNIRSFEDSLSSQSWHFCYIFSQKEVLVPVKSLRRGGLLCWLSILNVSPPPALHSTDQICWVSLCDRFTLCRYSQYHTPHHTTPHHTTPHHTSPHRLRQKWGKAGEVRAGGDSDSESNHRTNHILILFSDEF